MSGSDLDQRSRDQDRHWRAELPRTWVRQAQTDEGSRPSRTSAESAELRRLRRENAELLQANEILKPRAIVGWADSPTKHTTLVLDALDMALWRRERAGH